jgi:2-methylcitrate dehydratase
MAREGMTGPCQPFEGRNGYFDHLGQYRKLSLPLDPNGKRVIEMMGAKRTPTEGSSQAALELIPQIRQWTKAEDIESIRYEMPFTNWQEIADPPKFDPRNRETADHSMPYMLARAIIDGEIYLNSFTKEKYMDPACRQLMAKMKFYPNAEWTGNAPARVTIRKITGEEKSWDSYNGVRHSPAGQVNTPMTDDEINAKFDRISTYFSIDPAQPDRARKTWANITDLNNIGLAIATLAKFGKPQPL